MSGGPLWTDESNVFWEIGGALYRREASLNLQNFVYYTSLETAEKIISSRTVWMRNSAHMNDSTEICYGFECLEQAWNMPGGTRFRKAVSFRAGVEEIIRAWFERGGTTFRDNVYLTCVSEHLPAEHAGGRLSMWRAYGRKNGVAMVLKPEALLVFDSYIPVYALPVLYGGVEDANAHLDHVASELEYINWAVTNDRNSWDAPEHLDDDSFVLSASAYFQALATRIKHPGFREEREWRIIYIDELFPVPFFGLLRPRLKAHTACINNQRQVIYTLPLDGSVPESKTLASIIDHVIVGPGLSQEETAQRMILALESLGFEDAKRRVRLSDIPLRAPDA